MKKNFLKGIALLAAAVVLPVFTACDDDDDKVKEYDLTINFTPGADLAGAEITNAKVILTSGNTSDTVAVTDLTQAVTVTKPQGQYTVTFNGKVADEAQAYVSGSTNAELYAATSVTINLAKVRQSSLIFKTIHSTGSAQYYVLDSYVEIVNNSDEVQYLDNVIICAPMANQKSVSAWQEAYPDKYRCGTAMNTFVLAFPGSGTDHPLQPGEFVVVADNAQNHKLGYGNDETKIEAFSVAPDLSNAQWEKFYDNGDIDNPAANLTTLYRDNQYSKFFLFGVAGRAFMLAKLPEGVTPEAYFADESNYETTPGTASTSLTPMIPSKYVLDAVEVYQSGVAAEENVPFFLPQDDLKGIEGNAMYAAKCVRRKVSKIENGRVYYQDTNNSSADFKRDQDVTPGVTPTAVD